MVSGADIRFDRFSIDTRRHVLAANGTTVPLTEKAYQILLFLIEQRHRVVSQEDILRQLFGGQVRSDTYVATQVFNVRKALGDNGTEQIFIKTIGDGYQFVGEVMPPAQSAIARPPGPTAPEIGPPSTPGPELPLPPRRGAWARYAMRRPATLGLAAFLALGLAAGTLWRPSQVRQEPKAADLSIAVLPFKADNADRADDILADVITGDLTTDLGHLPRSRVTAGESAGHEKTDTETKLQTSRRLNVHYLVWGNLVSEGQTYRLAVHLYDAEADGEVWGRLFTFNKVELGDLRQAIVGSVASSLNASIDELIASRSHNDRPSNPTALDLYYQARYELDREDSPEAYRHAVQWLRLATQMEPNFSDALAQLGWVLLHESQLFGSSESDRRDAQLAVKRANDLSPRNTTAMGVKALFLETDGHCLEAEHVAEEIVQRDGSNVQAQSVLIGCAWQTGRLDVASQHLQMLEQIDPDAPGRTRRHLMQAHIDMLRGSPAEAIHILHGVIADFPPPSANSLPLAGPEYARVLLMEAYAMNGQIADAMALYRDDYSAIFRFRSVWRVTATTLSRAIEKLEKAKSVPDRLHDAGMPLYQDEDAVPNGNCDANSNGFSPTPARLLHGQTLKTDQMRKLAQTPGKQVVIDTGLGNAVFPGAIWSDHGESMNETILYVDEIVAKLSARERGQAIILMDSGPFGCGAYMAAENLATTQHLTVGWYRGGEEAWSRTSLPATDHRPY